MILFILIIPLIINVVTANFIINIDLLRFMNLQMAFTQGFIMQTIKVEEVINFDYQGINEISFENEVENFIKVNAPNTAFKVSYYYYNSNNTWCDTNYCDSVQFKIENIGALVTLNYEFNYQVKRNF